MMKKVYICAPLGGDVAGNLEKAKRYSEYALRCGAAPVTPHFYAMCLNDSIPKEREMGIAAGLSLLWFCDEVWVFGDETTEGMAQEIKLAHNLNIKVRIIKEHEIKKVIGDVLA
ncbi:hypothetical protein D1841_09805 [Neglecta sp. X4]|uniref:DUF7768 domain-containing protein n=1 Tax=unclassified Neglectibacter TaxID=2632164 RepID=UPI0013708A8A|nr:MULTISPECIES: DUF4406 domain-containing protein [unclassified Neglectibacter]NBI17982.1 hypothetical protein [Neglectibacter sp. 59]NBJ73579.1 hypothetical protein [Neglectibacter sp. X4]NCE81364.1 hypothetical protein [Neglectibacter sp. X58]